MARTSAETALTAEDLSPNLPDTDRPALTLVPDLPSQGGETPRFPDCDPRDVSQCYLMHSAPSQEEYRRLRNEVVERNLGLVTACAHRLRQSGSFIDDDILQMGRIGLIKAVERWDPEIRPLSVFAWSYIAGEMRRGHRDNPDLPTVRAVYEAYPRVKRGEDKALQEVGRMPTVAEIAKAAQMDEKDVEEVLTATQAGMSFDNRTNGNGESSEVSIAEQLVSTPDFADRADEHVFMLKVLGQMEPEEVVLLVNRHVHGRTQRELGEEQDVTQMHMSRILRRTHERMADIAQGRRPQRSLARVAVTSPAPGTASVQ